MRQCRGWGAASPPFSTTSSCSSITYLVFGEADQLRLLLLRLLGLHEAHRHHGAHVSAEGAHWFRGHARVPQQHPVVHARRGCNQSEETSDQTEGGAEEPVVFVFFLQLVVVSLSDTAAPPIRLSPEWWSMSHTPLLVRQEATRRRAPPPSLQPITRLLCGRVLQDAIAPWAPR